MEIIQYCVDIFVDGFIFGFTISFLVPFIPAALRAVWGLLDSIE